ncbi:hypothetical protein BJ742DRAFT_844944 [Cladochytrium replicatum]|nr:hypothetical protein BJ742DRAFT_844944 [Cladochytrium replicatum]
MSSVPGLDAGGAVLLGGAALVSAVASVYAAYRASKLPRIFNWILFGSFALMFISDALAFVPSFIPTDPYITPLIIYDFVLTLNIMASSIKTTCNLIRFDGVFRTILGGKIHYRSWMNRALVVFTILVTILAITMAWVVDIYPFYHGGIQAPGLPPQFQGGVTGSIPATIWVVLLDWIIAVMSLSVVRMLRSKWKVLREAMQGSSAEGSHVGENSRPVKVNNPATPFSQQSQQALLERSHSHTQRADSHFIGDPVTHLTHQMDNSQYRTSTASLKGATISDHAHLKFLPNKSSSSSLGSHSGSDLILPDRVSHFGAHQYTQPHFENNRYNVGADIYQPKSFSPPSNSPSNTYPPHQNLANPVWLQQPPPPMQYVAQHRQDPYPWASSHTPSQATETSAGNGQQPALPVPRTKTKRRGPMTYDDKSERGVRIIYLILSLQVALPICVMPFFFIFGGNLTASGITGIFVRIYNLIILEYMYTIGTVVKYTSKQAMMRGTSTSDSGIGVAK